MRSLLLATVALTIATPVTSAAQDAAANAATSDAAVHAAAAAAAPTKDPATAARQVEQALKHAEGVPSQGVAVSTHAETVLLTGAVRSEAEAARAKSVAEKAAEPLRVSSQLEVHADPRSTVRDEATAALVGKVEEALRRDLRTANLGVAVSVDEKQVIGLHGLVPNVASRTAAEDVAGRVMGVKQVRSHLVVPGE